MVNNSHSSIQKQTKHVNDARSSRSTIGLLSQMFALFVPFGDPDYIPALGDDDRYIYEN
jgi:hypothetical protein